MLDFSTVSKVKSKQLVTNTMNSKSLNKEDTIKYNLLNGNFKDVNIKNPFRSKRTFEVYSRTKSIKPSNNLNKEPTLDNPVIIQDKGKLLKYLIESDVYTRVYTNETIREQITTWENATKLLYFYITLYINRKAEVIDLTFNEETMGMSINTYKKALVELLDEAVIISVSKIKNLYWVDFTYISPSSRIDKFPECMIQRIRTKKL